MSWLYIGGLVGRVDYYSFITNCYSVGEVNATGSGYVGGLIGVFEPYNGIINGCYFLDTSGPV